jgi:hypothetical protein
MLGLSETGASKNAIGKERCKPRRSVNLFTELKIETWYALALRAHS